MWTWAPLLRRHLASAGRTLRSSAATRGALLSGAFPAASPAGSCLSHPAIVPPAPGACLRAIREASGGARSEADWCDCRASIQAEWTKDAPSKECITGAHLAAALECARCSVSAEQTAHFDEIERGMLTGGIAETAVQKAVQAAAAKDQTLKRQELVSAAVTRATESVAAVKIASLESALCEREKHVLALTQALLDAGLPVPVPT